MPASGLCKPLRAAVGAEAPEVAFRIADCKAARPVVLVGQTADYLRARPGGALEQRVGLVCDDVDRAHAGLHHLAQVVSSRRAEHHSAATTGPEQFGVHDRAWRLAGV